MHVPKGLIGVGALAVLTFYALLVALETEGWATPYLSLFSLIGKWAVVAVLAFLTLLALISAWKSSRTHALAAKPSPPPAAVAAPALPARKAGAMPVVSPERMARALRGQPAGGSRLLADRAAAAEAGGKPSNPVKPAKPPQKMLPLRSNDRVSVRLVPQVPITFGDDAAGWLAGAARLPPGMAWPAIDGEALQLLAQIDCTQLPPGLWGGLGPRQGWLAVFLGPRSYRPHVLHFHEAGALQPTPAMPSGSYILGSGAVPAFPRWPVDLIAVPAGQEAPRREGASHGMKRLLAESWDVTESRFLPFDWPSAQRMMELAADTGRASPAAHETEIPKKLQNLKAAVDTMAASVPFSAVVMDLILAEMRSLVWPHPASPQPRGEGGQPAGLPFTSHDPAAPGWQCEYVLYLQERAKHVYAEDPHSLPDEFLADCEDLWKEQAADGVAGMGHVPWAMPREFDEDQDITLLELPSSELMNWRFGGGKNLVLTMKASQLASSRFGSVDVNVI